MPFLSSVFSDFGDFVTFFLAVLVTIWQLVLVLNFIFDLTFAFIVDDFRTAPVPSTSGVLSVETGMSHVRLLILQLLLASWSDWIASFAEKPKQINQSITTVIIVSLLYN